MQKIKIFSKNGSMGISCMGNVDYTELENEVNEFIAQNNIEVLDIQYKFETTGSVIVIGVMVVYKIR